MTTQNSYGIVTWDHILLACSSPLPVWTGHEFSFCFQDLVFGCAADLVTLSLICIYHNCYSITSKQKIKKSAQVFGLRRALWLEMLSFLCILLTICQGLQLVFGPYHENIGDYGHTFLYICLQGLAWVSSCWVLHYHYAVVMADYWFLRLWWLLRPIFHIACLDNLSKNPKMLWTPKVLEELVLLLNSSVFGISAFIIGAKISPIIHSKNREFPLLIDPLLNGKHSQKHSHLIIYEKLDHAQHSFKTFTNKSLWAILLFTWVTPLMDLGTTRQLEYDDLLKLPKDLDPHNCSKWVLASWMDEQRHKESQSSLFHSIYLVYRWQYIYIGFVKILNDASGFAGPLLLHAIVGSMENGSKENGQHALWCAVGIGFLSVFRAFMGTQYTFLIANLKLQLRASINMLIYHRALHASLSDRSKFSNGEIQTLMSVDAERIVNLCGSLHELWSLPLQMIISLSMLYLQVKFSFVAGLLVIILLIPVNKVIATKIGIASQLMMKAKDERVRRIGEILAYIRTIKMYAWEDVLCKRVLESRKEEVKYLGVRKYLDAWCVYFWATTPILFSVFTFGLYSLLGYDLDAATVFTSLSLFNMLISPLNSFPWVINGIIEAFVSLRRLSAFLLCSKSSNESTEKRGSDVEMRKNDFQQYKESYADYAISMWDASFSWANCLEQNKSEHLEHINFVVPKGKKVMILGQVGSGKSSLLQAILGEMRQIRGQCFSQGQFGYVSQIPWILSGTVRDNILFGRSFVKDRYESILSACALDIDVERMAGKDLCMIGEQGFNLSGGQRSRLALARALYQDCDIYLFDDPLSSVDTGVASWLIDHVFSGPLLAGKTMVFSTYNSQAISVADTVILMENGQVIFCGPRETFSLTCNDGSAEKRFADYYIKPNVEVAAIHHPTKNKEQNVKKISTIEETLSCTDNSPVAIVEEEGRVQGAVRAMVYRSYAAFVGKKWVLIILVSITLMQFSRNGSDFWLSVWVDNYSDSNSAAFQIKNPLFLKVFLCLAVANSLFTAARAFSFAYGGLSAAFKVHESLLYNIMAAPTKFFSCNPKGRILNRFSSDQYAVDDSLPFITNILLANFFSLLGIFVILSLVQWSFLVILIPLGYIYISLQKYYRCTSRELRRLDSTSRSPIYSSFNEALDGSATIRAFKAQDIFLSLNEGFVALNQRTSFSEVAASLWLSIRLQLLAAFIIFFISMMSSWRQQMTSPINHATAGLVGLALSYATPMISLLSDLLSTFTETEKEMVSVERINEYMEVESEQQQALGSTVETTWPLKGVIEFHNVTLHYGPQQLPALKDVSFLIPGGLQKVGIAGRTGAGKSSILSTLFRLTEPTKGCITVDDTDISKIYLHHLRSKLAIVPQTPFLFEGTIRDNIDIHGKFEDHKLWDVLEKCHLKQTISSFGGLDMSIKEGGEMLSLGQRQLLCLSRVFLQATKVICLDECTANVDPQTTNFLQRAIASECEGKTVITIAHRVQSILNLDRVLILENGRLVEEGNPQALLIEPSSKLSSFVRASGS